MNKKSLLLLVLSSFLLLSCSNNDSSNRDGSNSNGSDNSSISPTSQDDIEESESQSEIDSIQDVNILHAWNWKLNDIKSRLKKIKKAGYGAIQISPMQPKVDKSGYANNPTASQWWKLYQPLEFKVAEGDENFLGTKEELTSLCLEAKKYDLKIVADIVSNHLAGQDNNYNSQVYTQYQLHTYGKKADDNNTQSVVQGHIGLPDLDTSTNEVQQAALGLLKEYIDCGVSGFRFDAAKHIETPEDGEYASNYWPFVLDGATSYAKSKNLDNPYYYGEILNTAGKNRSFSQYINYMSIVDNKQGHETTVGVDNGSLNQIKTTYNTKVNPNHLVLWAESHDTYANDDGYDYTRDYTSEVINTSYMIQASRKDASTLYFARPSDMGVTICSIDETTGWKNKEIEAINKFHLHYVDKSEHITKSDDCFINVRGKGSYAGVAIININNNNAKHLIVEGIKDGTYIDLISKDEYQIQNGEIDVKFTNHGCLLIPKKNYKEDEDDGSYDSSLILLNTNKDYSYLAWVWSSSISGHWVAFNEDRNGIGINLSSGDNFIIVEFPKGTTTSNADWNNKIRQTVDMSYNGNQTIIDYKDLVFK